MRCKSILKNIALQLYSVREDCKEDFIGVLQKVAKMGYTEVEFAGYGNIPAKKMKEALTEYGLTSVGAHINIGRLTTDFEEEFEYNSEIGTEYIICSWSLFETKDMVLKNCEILNKIAEKVSQRGKKFAYHNHSHEFKVFDGEFGLDIFYKNTDSALIKAELDVCWVANAGLDVCDYISKLGSRVTMLHLKELGKDGPKDGSDFGEGVIDFAKIIELGKKIGCEHYIVEHTEFKSTPLEGVKADIDYLCSLNI